MASAAEYSAVGIYTRTVARSPVIRWIFNARIRSSKYEDVVFVGEDFVQVKQLSRNCNLVDITIKHDFDARIRAASILDVDSVSQDKAPFVKQELDSADCPLHILVLTLDSNDLVFLHVKENADQSKRFIHTARSIPAFARTIMQPGVHLAIDRRSRAVAIAALECELILYSIKPRGILREDLQKHDVCDPILTEKPLAISGVIQAIDFLFSPNANDEHVILILLVVDEHRTKAMWVDWHATAGPHHAQVHPGQVLDLDQSLPLFLVPIADTDFLLASGDKITHWKNLLSGFAISETLNLTTESPAYPGSSANLPLWTNWSRPQHSNRSNPGSDRIYMLREDGLLFLAECRAAALPRLLFVADLGLHHGYALGSHENSHDRDIIVAGGDMTAGLVACVERREMSLHDITDGNFGAAIEITEHVQNWATVTDMVATGHRRTGQEEARYAESLLVTSGRNPFGSITELRKGLEARLLAFTEMNDLKTFTDIWALPDTSGSITIVLSSPSGTKFLAIAPDENLEEVADSSVYDTEHRTFAIDLLPDGWVAQVTAQKLCVSNKSTSASWKRDIVANQQVLIAAAFERRTSALITVIRGPEQYEVRCTCLKSLWNGQSDPTSSITLGFEPIGVVATTFGTSLVTCVSSADGNIIVFVFADTLAQPISYSAQIPASDDQVDTCDSLAVFRRPRSMNQGPELLLVCGLRDGRIVTFNLEPGSSSVLCYAETIHLGYSTVKISPVPSDETTAIAVSGRVLCLIRWDSNHRQLLVTENIWITDRNRPEFAQSSIVACAQAPSSEHTDSHPYSDTLIMLSDDSLLIATIDQTVKTVPRQMQLIGTPFRLLYAESIRSLVVASLRSTADDRRRTRQVWPVLEFIPRRSPNVSYYHDMQPGEMIRTIIEWPYRFDGDKMYSHILVGGSYQRRNGGRRGRITFLKPIIRNWIVEGVKIARKNIYDHEVTALAMFDSVTYVACAGTKVYLERFVDETRTWDRLCPPFQLASPGVFLSVEPHADSAPIIVITTSMDSVIMLQLQICEPVLGESPTFSLECVGVAPQAESSLSHLAIPTSTADELGLRNVKITLLSTKYRKIVGLACPIGSPFHNGRILFDAYLPQSITRMIRSPPSARKALPPGGIVGDRMVGCSADGSITGLVILQAQIWSRLFWLQRLCEWSDELSPHSHRSPRYSTSTADKAGQSDRPLPASLSNHSHLAMLRTPTSKPSDMHIDGDVISRVLRPGGAEAIRRVIDALSLVPDAIGLWLSQHKEEELVAIDSLIRLVRQFEAWI
jgi:hypothetical protein